MGGEPSRLAATFGTLGEIGRSVEVRREAGAGGAVSVVRLLVDDADSKLPAVLKSLDGADVRSANVAKPSFDEVFFQLVQKKG